MDPIEVARLVITDRFPHVRAAYLTGSVVEGHSNEYSDLDIVLVLEGPPAPCRETFRERGWLVELFMHTDTSLEHFYRLDYDRGTCTLARMVADGLVLAGDEGEAFRRRAQAHIDAGAPPWTQEQIDYRRYLVTDALDDLRGARDADERDIVAGQLMVMSAELHLAAHAHWGGKGKWLLRQLRDCDPVVASSLMAAHRAVVAKGDIVPLAEACQQILAPLGGLLSEGFVVRA